MDPQTAVLGNTVTIQAGPLAKTGPESAGLTLVGLMLLMAGATIRLCISDDPRSEQRS